MSLRSPLGRALGHGSAKSGSSHWYTQRVTAVALALLGLWFVVSLACLGSASYETVAAWLRAPVSSVLSVLLLLVAAWHAVIGLQVVVEDYVPSKNLRAAVMIVITFAMAAAAVTGVLAVLRIAFGAAA
jgi:succinate dehydrogenase / fumarate reductase, membrane anchor subunit